MGRIHLLDQNTINQIAAGEVVERPVSVVKELTENAIDAGATAITIEIKQGGIDMIRVTDNGGGIAGEDLPTAFKRHSTSKITDATDLLTVSSLGFRGEALSSIAAVARVELITRTHTSLIGSRYVIEGGRELVSEEVGAPEGTTIIVRDLFFNTPARRKFLKTAATEGSYIHDMIGKMALSRPDISFRYIQNGQNKLHTSGNHNLKDVIYQVYGRELTKELIPLNYESSFFRVEGFIGKPLIARSSRAYEIYFINGRYIKSSLIHKAIEEGYRNFLMQHKFPFTVFQICIDPEFTDVNVHPSKMELRFRNQEFLYEEIVTAVRKTLTSGELSPGFTVEPAGIKTGKIKKNPEERKTVQTGVLHSSQAETKKETTTCADRKNEISKSIPSDREMNQTNTPKDIVQSEKNEDHAKHVSTVQPESSAYETSGLAVSQIVPKEKPPEPFEVNRRESYIKEENAACEAEAVDLHQQNLFEDKLLTVDTVSQIHLAGQIFDTYWIVQFKDTFMIVDQHAAHEKVLYESILKKLKNQEYTTQQMNPPAIITLTPKQQEQLGEIEGLLRELGFEMEPFGGNEYAVYGMPDNLVGVAPLDFLEELLESAAEKGKITPEAVYERAATMACKAAIKGNQHLSEVEARQLMADLVTLENPYTCPHGRPTMIRMTQYELEKKFKRVL